MTLLTLAVHNSIASAAYQMMTGPRLNGIACPTCGTEMIDPTPNIVLTSCPPQKHVKCTSCDYSGTAYA